MIINEKIIHELEVFDLTLSLRPVREVPGYIRITIRNDLYVYSSIVYMKDLYNDDSTSLIEYIIGKFIAERGDKK